MQKSLLCVVLLAALAAPASSQVLPTGFFEDILVSPLNEPVGLAFLPDGRLLFIEQRTAAIKVWIGGASASVVGTVPNVRSTGNEQGLLGIAVDPQWPARPYVYVWFDYLLSANMRLSMFTVSGDLSNPASTNLVLGAQYDIVTDIPDNASNHNGGALRFGPDGMLYLSIGDDASSCSAQNTGSARGCVWRMDVSALPGAGSGPPPKSMIIPTGNPYAGPGDNDRLVWCHGLRNPFRFHIDQPTGNLYIADVGQNAWEEISENTSGGQNFGWPWFEGNAAFSSCGGVAPPSVPPIATWSHATGAAAIISLGRYRNGMGPHSFGPSYDGDYFYLDYYVGAIRRLQHNGVSWVTPPPVPGQPNANDWATGFGTVADALQGPDGALYLARQFGPGFTAGALRRIRANPNAPMLTVISGANQPGNAGRPLEHPMIARLTTIFGVPLSGATVNFTPFGGGTTNPSMAVTDSQGYAQTTYTLATTFTSNPVVVASHAGAPNVSFPVTWRGVVVNYIPAFSFLNLTVRHSQTNAPITVCFETPPVPSPYVMTAWGDVWTSVITPMAGLGAFDGMGLLGPPDPNVKTGATNPLWSFTASPLPVFGGVTFLLQAYGIDTSLYPLPEAIMITNAPVVTLN